MDEIELHPSDADLCDTFQQVEKLTATTCALVQGDRKVQDGEGLSLLKKVVERCRAVDLDSRVDVANSLDDVFFVRKPADWSFFLQKHSDFVTNIKKAGFLTFDSEDNLTRLEHTRDKSKSFPDMYAIESFLMGDPVSGVVVVIMVHPFIERNKTLEDILPKEWLELLADPNLWKIGVAIDGDLQQVLKRCKKLSAIVKVVDLGQMVKNSSLVAQIWPRMSSCSGSLKHICRLDQDLIYGVGDIRKKYGVYDGKNYWHTHHLYRWHLRSARRSRHPYRSEACAYLINDGRYPYRFLAKLCLKFGQVSPFQSIAKTLRILCADYQHSVQADSKDWGVHSFEESRPVSRASTSDHGEPLVSKSLCNLCQQIGHMWKNCQLLEGEEPTKELYELALVEGFKPDPVFLVKCDFCGSRMHHWNQCQARIREETCVYPLCEGPSYHTIAVCPTLHHRCSTCQIRGHHESQCGPYEQVRGPFLIHMTSGFYTRYCNRPMVAIRPSLIHFGLFPVSEEIVRLPNRFRGFSHNQAVRWSLEKAMRVCQHKKAIHYRKRSSYTRQEEKAKKQKI